MIAVGITLISSAMRAPQGAAGRMAALMRPKAPKAVRASFRTDRLYLEQNVLSVKVTMRNLVPL